MTRFQSILNLQICIKIINKDFVLVQTIIDRFFWSRSIWLTNAVSTLGGYEMHQVYWYICDFFKQWMSNIPEKSKLLSLIPVAAWSVSLSNIDFTFFLNRQQFTPTTNCAGMENFMIEICEHKHILPVSTASLFPLRRQCMCERLNDGCINI